MKKIFPYLTYAGLTPFIFFAACLSIGIQQIPLFGSVEKILGVYGLIILSFLAGSHWGQHLHINTGIWNRALPIVSNITAVLLWLGFLVLSFKMLMLMFVFAFAVLLVIDYRLLQVNLITPHYFQTRFVVSVITIIALIIAVILS